MLRIKKRPFIQPRATIGMSAFLIGLVGSVGILQALNSSDDTSSDTVSSSKVRNIESDSTKKKPASGRDSQNSDAPVEPTGEAEAPRAQAPSPAWSAPIRRSASGAATSAAPYYPQSTATPQGSTYNNSVSSPSTSTAPTAPSPTHTQPTPSSDTTTTDNSGTPDGTNETSIIDDTVEGVTAPLEDTTNVLE